MTNLLIGHAPDCRTRLVRRGHLVHDVQLVGGFAQDVIGPTVGRRHARHEQIAGSGKELASGLVALELERHPGGAAADGGRGRDAVEGLPPEVIEQVVRGVVVRAPRGVGLVPHVCVHVDHRGHDRLAGGVHADDAGWQRYGPTCAEGGNPAVLNQEHRVLDGRATAAVDDARALERHCRRPPLREEPGHAKNQRGDADH